MKIPFLSFKYMHDAVKNEMHNAFAEVFQSGQFILGSKLEQFEAEYAHFNGVKYSVGVSNGLDGLFLSLKALGIGKGDEVIVPSNTFIASFMAVSLAGAKIIPVEPRMDTYNIDPERIREAVTARTKAIMPVHLYGQCADMESVMNIAGENGLFIVEDNAQSHGARFRGKLSGGFGDLNATSFYPAKNLGALGDAGVITSDNAALVDKVKLSRNYGSSKKYQHSAAGYNMRMDELQAAFLSVKLRCLDEWNRKRVEIAGWYNSSLKNVGDLVLPVTHPDSTHVYHLYVIRTEYRNQLQQWLSSHDVDTIIHYPVPPHLQDAYRDLGYKIGSFPIAEKIAETCLSLPLWPGMQQAQVLQVAGLIKEFYLKNGSAGFNRRA
jgi:dTDP-4-amino-4,6-dideoxygalactose transaminase